jgi:uncharacterized OB-fold protein
MSEQRCLNCGKIDFPFEGACRWCGHSFDVVVSETPDPVAVVTETATPIPIVIEPKTIEVAPVKTKPAIKKQAKKKSKAK